MVRINKQRRFHHRFYSLTLALILALAALLPRPAMAQDSAQQILDAINAARAEHGLGALVVNPLLNQAAQGHVNDMITNYVYGHYGSDGSTVHMRVARTGYSQTPWVSENWVSASSPGGAMRWWMGDYIHRVNILTPRWVEVGIGVGTRGSEMIFVTVFSAGGGLNSDEAAIAAAEMQKQAAEPPPPSVKIEQVTVPAEGMEYAVVGGDTLLAIGLRHGLPWERIAEANGLNERSILQIGQTLRIPGSGAPAAPPPPEVPTEEYTVQPNDTLYSIAATRGMYWDEVAAVNGFGESTVLQIGQVIKVPVVEVETPVETTRIVESRANSVRPVTPEQSPANFDSYSLMKFDPAPTDVAEPDGAVQVASTGVGGPVPGEEAVEVASSELANPAGESSVLSEGMGATSAVLEAHAAAASAATAETAEAAMLYQVQPGDTIISIAIANELEWGALLELNGLSDSSVLQPGQTLRLR